MGSNIVTKTKTAMQTLFRWLENMVVIMSMGVPLIFISILCDALKFAKRINFLLFPALSWGTFGLETSNAVCIDYPLFGWVDYFLDGNVPIVKLVSVLLFPFFWV